jgi:hypothetical protein
MSVEERIELYFQDDLRDAKLMAIDGWWNHIELLLRGKGRLPSYLQNITFDNINKEAGLKGQVEGEQMIFETFLDVCSMHYNSARPFYMKHPYNKGVCDNMCVLVTQGKTNMPSTLRIDYRMFIYLFYLMSLDRWDYVLSGIIEYLWRWMALHFLSVSSFFSAPKDSFRDNSFTPERVSAIEDLAKKDGSYTLFRSDAFPKLRRPSDELIRHPIGRNVEETLMTIELVRRLIDYRCGTADIDVFSSYGNSDQPPYDTLCYNVKFSMISNLLIGVMHKTRKMLIVNGLSRPFKTSMLFKREFRKSEYTEINDNAIVGSLTKGSVMLTKKQVRDMVGFRYVKPHRGYCPHPSSRNSIVITPCMTDSVYELDPKVYLPIDGADNENVTDVALHMMSRQTEVGNFNLDTIEATNSNKRIFWYVPSDAKGNWTHFIERCRDNPNWHKVEEEDMIRCNCGRVVAIQKGRCVECDCDQFQATKAGCRTCGHSWQTHEMSIPKPIDLSPEPVEPKARLFEPCSYEDEEDCWMLIGGGYVYKSRDNWFSDK